MVNIKAGAGALLAMLVLVFLETIFLPIILSRVVAFQNDTNMSTTGSDTLDAVPDMTAAIVMMTIIGGFIGSAYLALKA